MLSETYTLSKPIKTHNGETTTITISEPTARSFLIHGEPFKTRFIYEGEDVRAEHDYNNSVMGKFLADMTGLDDIILGSLRSIDFIRIRSIATNLVYGAGGTNPQQT